MIEPHKTHAIKIFQRKDGSLLFCVSYHPGLAPKYVQSLLKAIPVKINNQTGVVDTVLCAPNCGFQFFNISDSQLREMEIKPEPPAEPK